MVTLTIDGNTVNAVEGTTILEAAQQIGIDIPYFCYHKDMEPYGGCRLCMVEVTVNDFTRLQPSCAYPVKDNLVVKTHTERVIRGRKMIAELLLARCPDVDSVKNLAASLGVTETRFTKMDKDCVLCGQCVRVCRNVANVGAIDFVNRGKNRYVCTPFDLPSDDCIGCGSCAYVCPTGAMNMEYENALRWRQLPGPMRKCRYMRMGLVSHKICPNNYRCWNCEVDQRMEDFAKTHPIFLLRQEREKEKAKIDQFDLPLDRMYDENHLWVRRINGFVRMGIDDFARKIIGRVEDIKLPPVDTKLNPLDPLLVISGNEKTLRITSPIEGKLIDINPHILDNPSLISVAPYERGWILTVEPVDMLEASRQLILGRSAKEWLKLESHKFHDLLNKGTQMDLSPEKPIPSDFARIINRDIWNKIQRTFFAKKKKKKIKLYKKEDIQQKGVR